MSDTITVPPTRLAVSQPAPDFTLPAAGGGTFALSEHRGEHVIVYFYPAAMTPGCTTQACDFRDSLMSLTASGYTVAGVSPDPVAKLETFTAAEGLTFALLSDVDRDVMTAYGAFGAKRNYGKVVTGTIRSTVVVGPDGLVEHVAYNVKATGHVAKLRRDLKID